MLETALSGLVNTMSWKVFVGFSPNLHQWCITGLEMNALNFGVKRNSSRSRWNNVYWNHHCTGGGTQYLTSHVQLDFLVCCCCMYYRYGCCRRCSSCVQSLTLTCVNASSSASYRYCRTTPSNSVKAGHLCLVSSATLQMVKGRSAQWSRCPVFYKEWFTGRLLRKWLVVLAAYYWEIVCLKVCWFG